MSLTKHNHRPSPWADLDVLANRLSRTLSDSGLGNLTYGANWVPPVSGPLSLAAVSSACEQESPTDSRSLPGARSRPRRDRGVRSRRRSGPAPAFASGAWPPAATAPSPASDAASSPGPQAATPAPAAMTARASRLFMESVFSFNWGRRTSPTRRATLRPIA